jgi:hypothetical protein
VAHSFQISLTAPLVALLNRAKQVAQESDAILHGDETTGSFAGSGVKGTYEIADGVITVTITRKPFFASWFLVETRIRELFI